MNKEDIDKIRESVKLASESSNAVYLKLHKTVESGEVREVNIIFKRVQRIPHEILNTEYGLPI